MKIPPGRAARILRRAVAKATDVKLEYCTIGNHEFCRTQRGHRVVVYHMRVPSPLPWAAWTPVTFLAVQRQIDEALRHG
jgi:hypothetical protein